eukprot:1155833-Pelagomonas_calceolata.AAC.4
MKQGREAAARVKLLPGKRRDEAGVGCPWAVQNVYFHGHAQPYILRDDVLCYVSLCPDCLQKHVSSGLLPNVFTEIKTTLAADSKTVDDKVDECVDDYPIRGRPSTTAWTMLRDMPPMLCVASCCQGLRIWSKAAGALRQTTCSSLCRAMLPVLKACLCALMLAAVALLFYYAFQLQPNKAPTERRAVVYDSVDSKARPFLLHRQSNGTNGSTQGMPGAAGRWAEGEESEVGTVQGNQSTNGPGLVTAWSLFTSHLFCTKASTVDMAHNGG